MNIPRVWHGCDCQIGYTIIKIFSHDCNLFDKGKSRATEPTGNLLNYEILTMEEKLKRKRIETREDLGIDSC